MLKKQDDFKNKESFRKQEQSLNKAETKLRNATEETLQTNQNKLKKNQTKKVTEKITDPTIEKVATSSKPVDTLTQSTFQKNKTQQKFQRVTNPAKSNSISTKIKAVTTDTAKSVVGSGVGKCQEELEQSDAEGVRLASQASTKAGELLTQTRRFTKNAPLSALKMKSSTAKTSRKLLVKEDRTPLTNQKKMKLSQTSGKLSKGTSKPSISQVKMSKQTSKLASHSFAKKKHINFKMHSKKKLQKKIIKRKLYLQKRQQMLRTGFSHSLSTVTQRIFDFFKKGKLGLALLKKIIFGKLALVGGGGFLLLIPVCFVGIIALSMTGILGAGTSPQDKKQTVEGSKPVLAEAVEDWRGEVTKQAQALELEEYIELALAIIQVETRGEDDVDIMQSAEFLKDPSERINTEVDSIHYGLLQIQQCVETAKLFEREYEDDLKLIAQTYNFGLEFLEYVEDTGGKFTLDVSETYSRDVLAPKNEDGEVFGHEYKNVVSRKLGKQYLYIGGKNFLYGEMVMFYLKGKKKDLMVLEDVLGKTVNNGECYGLTAYYVEMLGGPKMMGSGNISAARIGNDYNWPYYGWEVIFNPKPTDIRAGDVINWQAGGRLAPGIYGHTGVVSAVYENGHRFETYEQNAGRGRICATYTRTYEMNPIASIIRKKQVQI